MKPENTELELRVIGLIKEDNALELADNFSRRYYLKYGNNTNVAKDFKLGEVVFIVTRRGN
jgi:hypothetical protein